MKKIPPHKQDAINTLLKEAHRFEALASDYALKFALSGQQVGRPAVIEQHMLRAETLRSAAKLIGKGAL